MQTVQDDSVAPTSGGNERSGNEESLAHAQANGRTAPVDGVERWPIDRLLPYAGNPKTHPPEQVALIAKSMARFGQAQIILIDGDEGPTRGEIIAGHGRVLAAVQLGWNSLAVGMARGWSAEEKRAYRVADNALAAAPWDMELLKPEVQFLNSAGFDTGLLGFDAPSMFKLLAAEPAVDAEAEATPELPETPVVRSGDLWVLGNHRLLCGDATVADDVAKLIGQDKPHLMVTDPPYGVDYDPDWRNKAMPAKNDPSRQRDGSGRAVGLSLNDDRKDWREAWALFPGVVAYCWHAGLHASSTQLAFESCGFNLRAQIIWAKQQFVVGRGHYHVQHEPCFYMVSDAQGATGHWQGDRKQSTVWLINKPQKSETGHSAQKPIECMKRPIENNSKPGDLVYDPFVGSGTTIIAAEIAARRCLAIEIDPGYVQVSIERWQKYAGKEATLGGRTFEDVKEDRTKEKGSRVGAPSAV